MLPNAKLTCGRVQYEAAAQPAQSAAPLAAAAFRYGAGAPSIDVAYLQPVDSRSFKWDPAKNRRNGRDHGIDFADATAMFDGPTWEHWDDREDYGEERWVAIGVLEGIEITVVYTDLRTRKDVVRQIISARRGNAR